MNPSTRTATVFADTKAILLEIPMSHEKISQAVVESCRMNKIRDGYIRLVVTRGVGTLALILILFAAGLELDLRRARKQFTGAPMISSTRRKPANRKKKKTRIIIQHHA